MERYIERVKSNIQAKASPLKLAETRLAKRSKESCNLPSLTSFLPPLPSIGGWPTNPILT